MDADRMLVALTAESAEAAHRSAPNAAVERGLLDAIRRRDERQASAVYASLLPAVH
jgi:hypothetical protein